MQYKIMRAYVVEADSKHEAVETLRATHYDVTYLEWQAIQAESQERKLNDPFKLNGEESWEDPLSVV